MTQQWHPHSTVACICENNGLFLMVKELVDGKLVYNQPAGHIEDNESIIEATLRETMEETAHKVEAKSVTGVYRFRVSPELTFIRFSLHCEYTKFTNSPIDPAITSVHWLSYEQLLELKDELRSPLVLKTIEDYKNGVSYPLSMIDNNT